MTSKKKPVKKTEENTVIDLKEYVRIVREYLALQKAMDKRLTFVAKRMCKIIGTPAAAVSVDIDDWDPLFVTKNGRPDFSIVRLYDHEEALEWLNELSDYGLTELFKEALCSTKWEGKFLKLKKQCDELEAERNATTEEQELKQLAELRKKYPDA